MRACMRRPFREALASTPVVLEIVPPGRRVSEKAVNSFVERVRDSVRSLKNLDAVNIPEVLEENHAGQPFYRDLDPRDFAALLGDLGVEPIVNKVVAHLPSESVLRRWIQESIEQHGLRNFVLVGGNSSRVRYPGPSVVEANRVLRNATGGRNDIALGNVAIAERDHEADRHAGETVARARWSHLRAAAAQSKPAVPLGVNIEEVSIHTFDLAVKMAREFPSWRGAEGAPSIPGLAPDARDRSRKRGSR